MSSSASRGSERMVQQDFIARIRFQNTLPPPPIPPKLLDVPSTGLASGQYTNPAFASRLAREQPLNIEADAELGMPLDLVGMPGIFDGDESSIQAPSHPPPIHPHDRALLKPLSALGKAKAGDASVSFLRRTEYISASSKKRTEAEVIRARALQKLNDAKRKTPEPDAGTPAYAKRKIEKSFDAANIAVSTMRASGNHPSKKNVTLVEALPMFPDIDSLPDSAAYTAIKFTRGPLPSNSGDAAPARSEYDTRLLSSLLRPIEKSAAEESAWQTAFDAHKMDPARNPRPPSGTNYDFFLADTARTADNFRAKFDVENPNRDDDDLYTSFLAGNTGRCFRFDRIRGYETAEEKEMTHETKFDEEVIVSCGESTMAGQRAAAAWYYPVMQRTVVRGQRTKSMARAHSQAAEDDDQQVDALDLVVVDPDEDLLQHIAKIRANPTGFRAEEMPDAAAQQLHEEESGTRANEAGSGASRSPSANGQAPDEDADGDAEADTARSDDVDEDAEGDEED